MGRYRLLGQLAIVAVLTLLEHAIATACENISHRMIMFSSSD